MQQMKKIQVKSSAEKLKCTHLDWRAFTTMPFRLTKSESTNSERPQRTHPSEKKLEWNKFYVKEFFFAVIKIHNIKSGWLRLHTNKDWRGFRVSSWWFFERSVLASAREVYDSRGGKLTLFSVSFAYQQWNSFNSAQTNFNKETFLCWFFCLSKIWWLEFWGISNDI
jgi:hypothetical protein